MTERNTAHGPYDTSGDALRDAVHVYDASRREERRGTMSQVNEGLLLAALAAAGVQLGEYERGIAGWLAGYEPETVQVIVGWIERAQAAADLAGFPWRVYAQPEGCARWLVNAFTTRKHAERFAARHPDQYGPLTIEPADPPTDVHPELVDGIAPATETAPPPQQEMTHHAVMRHGIGGPECGTGRVWEPMTRAWKDVTCPDCLASLDVESGGAQ